MYWRLGRVENTVRDEGRGVHELPITPNPVLTTFTFGEYIGRKAVGQRSPPSSSRWRHLGFGRRVTARTSWKPLCSASKSPYFSSAKRKMEFLVMA